MAETKLNLPRIPDSEAEAVIRSYLAHARTINREVAEGVLNEAISERTTKRLIKLSRDLVDALQRARAEALCQGS